MPILCHEGLKYKIKNHWTFMRLEIMRQPLNLHMTNPELEISTSVLSLLLRIQRVELDVTFHNKLHFMEHFCAAILLLEPQANYVFVASHFTYK